MPPIQIPITENGGAPLPAVKPFSTYPEDRERLIALSDKVLKRDQDIETMIGAAITLADLVKATLEDEAIAETVKD